MTGPSTGMGYSCRWHDSCTLPSYGYGLEQCGRQDTVVGVDFGPLLPVSNLAWRQDTPAD